MDEQNNDSRSQGRSSRGRRSSGGRSRRRQWRRRPRRCYYCTEGIDTVDYKDANQLRRFVTSRGKIRPRRQTGACARHQRQISKAIKRARHLAMLPLTAGHGQTSR